MTTGKLARRVVTTLCTSVLILGALMTTAPDSIAAMERPSPRVSASLIMTMATTMASESDIARGRETTGGKECRAPETATNIRCAKA